MPGVSAVGAAFAVLGRELATAAAGLLLVDAAMLVGGEQETIRVAAYGVLVSCTLGNLGETSRTWAC